MVESSEIPTQNKPNWNVTDFWQQFKDSHTPLSYTLDEYLAEFTKSCGSFKSPLSLADKLELIVAKRLARSKIFTGLEAISNYSIPANWQILLNYLYQKKVISAPEFSPIRIRNDFPTYFGARLTHVFDPVTTDGRKVEITGGGATSSIEISYAKAVGELLERYFFTQYRTKDSLVATQSELERQGKNPVSISHFNSYLPEQYKRYPYFKVRGIDSTFLWTQVKNLTANTNAYVPTQAIYWNYSFTASNTFEPRLLNSTTSGCAGQYSTTKATTAALLELVQRDAFCMYWLNTLSPKRLVLEDETLKNSTLKNMLAEAKEINIEVFFLDTTNDIEIPSCTCVTIDKRGERPVISLGASAGFDLEEVLLSALFESLLVNQHTSSQKPYILPIEFTPFSDTGGIIGRDERLSLWQGENMLEKFTFFIAGEETLLKDSRFARFGQTFSSEESELVTLLNLFRAKGEGYEVYRYEVEHEILMTLGYHVVRVIVPKLFPLYLVEHMATLDSDRLRSVPPILGYTTVKENPWPHPFP